MGKKASYGLGHPNFIKYKHEIISDENYADMPDLYFKDEKIQWEAPSNRKSGIFKKTHLNRKKWWENKATSLGIDISENFWISRTAKLIHPTKTKPCINCGEFMDIRYSYPTQYLINRIKKLKYVEEDFEINKLIHIVDLLERLFLTYGDCILNDFEKILKCRAINEIPKFENFEEALDWVTHIYIPKEPNMLSPGVMSNAPDRLDGFHNLNLCCRSKKDSGRYRDNLNSYSTDRRAFEYWVEGDWIAADRLMGYIRSNTDIRELKCLNKHDGPCAADHIGPISLGFRHRPEFQLLCNSCNSAKNNRMTLSDVETLISIESKGEVVTSWYASHLWNLRKNNVNSKETALRLSKMLRDNRHTAMHILFYLYQQKHLSFLMTFLELDFADRNISLQDVKVNNHIVSANPVPSKRETTYSEVQKIRRIRIGIQALESYASKENRNALLVSSKEIQQKLEKINKLLLNSSSADLLSTQNTLYENFQKNEISNTTLQDFLTNIPQKQKEPISYIESKELLSEIMKLVGQEISNMWTHDRYVRAEIKSLD